MSGEGLASFGGVKLQDLTGDGFSADDLPMGGVSIELFRDGGDGVFDGADDVLVNTQVSDAVTGQYTFADIASGRYFLREQVPTGFTQTAGPSFYSLVVHGDCVFAISETPIDDFNNPVPVESYFLNAFDPDPTLIQHAFSSVLGGERDVLIDVLGSSNPLSASVVVGFDSAEGVFSFASAAPGTSATLQYDGVDADMVGPPAALVNSGGLNADLTQGGSQTGLLLRFTNVDPGLASTLEVEIRATGPGGATATLTQNLPVSVNSVVSFAAFADFTTAGGFSFSDVESLEVVFNGSGAPDVDFILDLITTAIPMAEGFDFGNFLDRSSLAGFVYIDADNDGVKDMGEMGIAGATVTLTGMDDLGAAVNTSTMTDAAGMYRFDNLRPGTYTITETQPAAFLDGKDTIGTPGGTTANDVFSEIVLPAGFDGVNNNFGELLAANSSLAGFVYIDADNDGVKDVGESGIAGVTVTLTGMDDLGAPVNRSIMTDAAGMYLFDNLRPGTYTITETQPAAFLDGKDTIGTPGGTTANDVFSNIMLPASFDGVNNNFGELVPSSLAGFVYVDVNNNGLKDAPELGIGGVAIRLTGTDDLGGSINRVTTTAATGAYKFAGLRPGTYTITETQPAAFIDGKDTIGTPGGMTANDVFSSIVLPSGFDGVNNNFGERGLLPPGVSKDLLLASTPDEPDLSDLGVTVGRGGSQNGGGFVATASAGEGVDAQTSAWLANLYQDVLGRAGADSEIQYWTSVIAGGASHASVAQTFLGSRERRGAIIDDLYFDYLGRGADASGLEHWLNAWDATGGPEAVQAGIIGSQEYFQRAGGTSADWVDALYQNILGRGADQSEIDFWVDELGGRTTHDVVLGFVMSNEYRAELIGGWYGDYLNRSTDQSGLQHWIGRMNQGLSQEAIQTGILASQEYRNLP